MKDLLNRSVLLLTLFLGACTNPFFEARLETGVKSGAEPAVYTVRFMRNHASNDTTVLYTRTVTAPAATVADFPGAPSRSGYTFAGWNTQANGTGSSFTASTAVSGDTTVYARWTENTTYTVRFMQNHTPEDTTVLHTKPDIVPAASIVAADFPGSPSRSGYTFVNWNTQADGSGSVFTASTAINADIDVYARWIENTSGSYTVAFKLNDGTDANWTAKTVASAASIGTTDFPVNPSRTGYTFASWNTQADGGGSASTESTTVIADITVYAKWTELPPNSYTVTFKKNDDTNADHAVKIVTSPVTTVVDFPVNPSRTGYTFDSWTTQADGGGSVFDATTTVSADTTVYAKWTALTYTVHFMRNYTAEDTTVLHTKTVTVPATTIGTTDFPVNPSRTGYTFASWNTQPNGGGSVFDATTGVSGNITVYAKWTELPSNSYTVTFKMNDGTNDNHAVKIVTSPASALADFPANPSRAGYVFVNWNTQADGEGSVFDTTTTVSADTTVYATWTVATGGFISFPDLGDGTFSQTTFTLSKSADVYPDNLTVTIDGAGYTNPRWFVDGEPAGTADSITINAVDYGVGGHTLSLLAAKDGISWSKELAFTIAN
jgi:uncharacterized repeat protein (TIGR02543 family)